MSWVWPVVHQGWRVGWGTLETGACHLTEAVWGKPVGRQGLQ